MKSTLQTILICSIIFVANGASVLRQKRQFDQQRDPQFFQQVPQPGDSRNNQQNFQFGQPNPQFEPQGFQSGQFGQPQDPALINGQFVGFGEFRPNQDNPSVGNGLTIGAGGRPVQFSTTPASTTTIQPSNSGLIIPGQGGMSAGRQVWSIASGPSARPTVTTTPSPITVRTRTTPSQTYLRCLSNCPSTMEYNPVCGSDDLDYHNMNRLVCANRCGNNVQMVRLGACYPL